MRQALEQCIRETSELMTRLKWDKETYADFLAQTYYFVCHSTRLLACAAARFPLDQEEAYRRFVAHMAEEKNHEKLAATDLKNLGYSLEQWPERPETRAFYEAQYFKIEHQSPAVLLGYILFLEAIAVHVGPILHKQADEMYGKKCSAFLRVHVEEDPDHVQKAIDMIESLPETQRRRIEANLMQSHAIYGWMLQALGHHAVAKPRAA